MKDRFVIRTLAILAAGWLAISMAQAQTLLLPYGAVWKYLDNGSDQGTAWSARTFDDTGWASGPAELGYGDGDEATVVSFGGDANNKHITTYFRHSFTVANPASFTNVYVRVERDDGVVVYLNGTEIFRDNMPAGAPTSTTAATAAIDDAIVEGLFELPAGLLVSGANQNVIAVEIHQASLTSSDISMNLQLIGNRPLEVTLLPLGSEWKYLDTGVDQGTAWVDPDFVDTSWASGPATLGYPATRNPATLVSFGADANNKYTTTYFRHAFDLASAAGIQNLLLRVNRDDGVVVHLNGAPVYTNNMPTTGPIVYSTFASSTQDGVVTHNFANTGLLVSGRNVVAAEIHQANLTSSDIIFDLSLSASPPEPPQPPSVAITSPTNNTATDTPISIRIAATASDADGSVARVEFYDGSTQIGQDTTTPYGMTWVNPAVALGAHTLTARAYDNAGLITTSAPVNITITYNGQAVVAPGTTWKYLDDGSDPSAIEPSIPWYSTAWPFDDSWLSGPAELGYGEGDEATLLSRTNFTGGTNITFYFRQTFDVANVNAYSNLQVRVKRDDGIIVYLNDVEIFRNNMPTGAVTYTTMASADAGDDGQTWLRGHVDRADLFTGQNLLAAEVHQSSLTSSDVTFDLMLVGNLPQVPPAVFLTAPVNNTTNRSPVDNSDRLTLTATATDADGTVTNVAFFAGATKIGDDATSPYSVVWSNIAPGNYKLTARATDDLGVSTTSTQINYTVVYGGVSAGLLSGATWKYLDNGTDQGTAWRALGFVDTTWPSGPSELGFGDGDEATLVTSNQQVTTYFRRVLPTFTPAAHSNLLLRVKRDDGVVVYVNNVEVFRSNMPTGAVTFATLASGAAGDDGDDWQQTPLSPGAFVAGNNNNIVAAEIHQNSTNSSDISFDLALIGNLPLSAPTVAITSPTNGANVNGSVPIPINATAGDIDGIVTLVEFFANGTKVGEDTTAGFTVDANLPAGAYALTAVATDNTGLKTTSAAVNITTFAGPVETVLVAYGSDWKYLDNGSDQGVAWIPPSFVDDAWASGPAMLGYPEADNPTTLVSFGPDADNEYTTTYFRQAFDVSNPGSFSNLVLNAERDDGVVVYLNGTPVYTNNMPTTGPILYNTFASATADGTVTHSFANTSLLVAGRNVVAAEIHQASLTSSDIAFDLELIGQAAPSAQTPLTIVLLANGDVRITWTPAAGHSLYEGDDPANINTPVSGNPQGTHVIPAAVVQAQGEKFYALR